jgi:hypothetical protein
MITISDIDEMEAYADLMIRQANKIKEDCRQARKKLQGVSKPSSSRKKCYNRSLVANAAAASQDNDDAFSKWVDELIEEAEENDIKRAEKKYGVDLSHLRKHKKAPFEGA